MAKERYNHQAYNTLPRWVSFWYQIDTILSVPEIRKKKILEIGVANKFVSAYLKSLGLNIKTCDIDKTVKPDVVGDVRHLPFKDEEFDVVICCEVLEHMPFEESKRAIQELCRVSKSDAILSLPYSGFCLSFYLKPPAVGSGWIFRLPLPLMRPRKMIQKYGVEHYWTLGELKTGIRAIRKAIKQAGWNIEQERSPILNSHHIFWRLKKVQNKMRETQ